MLTSCPECSLQVSDLAISCPHCGYPLKPAALRRTKKKRARLPNGFGQISKIQGNLTKPYRAMVTVGTKANGRPKVAMLKPEAYFRTYNEAYEALLKYNKDPFDLSKSITMTDLFEKWAKEKAPELKSKSTLYGDRASWKYAEGIYGLDVREVRKYHIKELLSNQKLTPVMAVRLKKVLNQLFLYAIEEDLAGDNPVKDVSVDKYNKAITANRKGHIAFTDDEVNLLWHCAMPAAKMMLIGIYSGWRPSELTSLKLENISIEENTMFGGLKTDAGKNRIVPIHPKIKPLIEKFYNDAKESGSEYLFNIHIRSEKYMSYMTYDLKFQEIISILNLNEAHSPHDTRVTFVTKCKKYNVDEYAIKYLVGHQIKDLTERVYTKRDPEWLRKEIQKIK